VRAHMLKCFAAGLLALAIGTLSTETAYAQNNGDRIDGNIAGTVGLGLLGAEVGLFLTPAFNLQDHWWAWVLFPAVGAAGGAVAGALTFDPGSPEPAVTVAILGAGMLLAVPAVVGASQWASARRANQMDEAQNGGGLLRFGKRGASFGAPSIVTAQVFSPTEQARYNLPQKTSTRLSLISGRF